MQFPLKFHDRECLMHALQSQVSFTEGHLILKRHPMAPQRGLQFPKVVIELPVRGNIKFLQDQGAHRNVPFHDVLGHHPQASGAGGRGPCGFRSLRHKRAYIRSRRTVILDLTFSAS
jgi:hypothetical protein